MTGLGRLEVLEMRVASSAGTNSNSSFMPSSSSTPFVSTEKDKVKEKEREKDKDNLTSKLSDKSKVGAIGMVVRDKGKKKKEKKGKGDNVNKKTTDTDENYTIDSVFRGKINSIFCFLFFRILEFFFTSFNEFLSLQKLITYFTLIKVMIFPTA